MKNYNATVKRFTSLLILSVLFIVIFLIRRALAADDPYGLANTAYYSGLKTADPSLPNMVGKIIGVILSVTGIIFLYVIIWGGNLYMSARGNEEQVEKAKSLITQAIIGIILIIGAYSLTYFIIDLLAPKAAPAG